MRISRVSQTGQVYVKNENGNENENDNENSNNNNTKTTTKHLPGDECGSPKGAK